TPSSSFSYILSISPCIVRCVRRLSIPSTTTTPRTARNPATSLNSRLRRSSQPNSAFISGRLPYAFDDVLQVGKRLLARVLAQLREVERQAQPRSFLHDEAARGAARVVDVLQREAPDLLGDPLRLERRTLLGLELVLHERPRLVRQHDSVGLGELLEPGGQVHFAADNR